MDLPGKAWKKEARVLEIELVMRDEWFELTFVEHGKFFLQARIFYLSAPVVSRAHYLHCLQDELFVYLRKGWPA